MGALLGYVVDIVVGAVMGMSEETVGIEMKSRVLRALNKVIWIQNDLFARHYVKEVGMSGKEEVATPPPEGSEVVEEQAKESVGGCPFAGR